MSACKPKENKIDFDYEALYRTEYTMPFEEVAYKTSRASHGYTLKNEQGYNGWYYMYGKGQYKEMSFKGRLKSLRKHSK